MSGTHVGIIGDAAQDPTLSVTIERALTRISAAEPFLPLVLHYGYEQVAREVARRFVSPGGGWRIAPHPATNDDIAAACHILIVIASGKENDPQSADIWSLAKKARASGRAIIHIPVLGRSPAQPPRQPATSRSKAGAVQPSAASLGWARSEGTRDMLAEKVIPKYSRFRTTHGLPDSPESLKLWQAYKKAAGVHSKKPEVKAAVPVQRKSGKKSMARTRRITIKSGAPRGSRPDPMGAVPLDEDTAVLLRKVNPPDPDVWR